ncbi:hypothetical protein ACFC1R_37070 [Kitasatospora sp. NPDC056138]|uniref:hypothetical protein n=1 Tax=Kitasatospora sp. NPDC056138 TaxID=3345724 RepID=UPI0035E2C3B4
MVKVGVSLRAAGKVGAFLNGTFLDGMVLNNTFLDGTQHESGGLLDGIEGAA